MTKKLETLKCDLNLEALTVTYKKCKRAGEDWETVDSQVFEAHSLPTDIQKMAMLYGLRAVLADRTSDAGKLGVDKLGWMREVYEMLSGGDWNKPRAVAAGKVDPALIQLICDLKGIGYAQAEGALKALDKETRKLLADKYASELAKIRQEAKAGVDLGDL